MANPVLGWRHDLERRAELRAGASPFFLRGFSLAGTKRAIDYRPYIKAWDQGRMNSCVGHGLARSIQILNFLKTGIWLDISRWWSYRTAQRVDGIQGDNGATIDGGAKAAKQDGSLLEQTLPYPNHYTDAFPSELKPQAIEHPIAQYAVLNSYAEDFQFLASEQGPILIGVMWDQSCVDCKGVLERIGGQVYGGHCVAIIGYTERKDARGRQYVILSNSHTAEWGSEGFAEVAPSVLDAWHRDARNQFIGLTDLKEFNPRLTSWLGGLN